MARSIERRIPSWLLEFCILAVLLLALRWWLSQKNKRFEFPAAMRMARPSRLGPGASPRPAAPSATPAVNLSTGQGDDLKRIEGIGPKVAGLLNAAGIYTFAQLASQTETSLRAVLREAGLPMINPAAWPEQARHLDAAARVNPTTPA